MDRWDAGTPARLLANQFKVQHVQIGQSGELFFNANTAIHVGLARHEPDVSHQDVTKHIFPVVLVVVCRGGRDRDHIGATDGQVSNDHSSGIVPDWFQRDIDASGDLRSRVIRHGNGE